MKRIRFGCPKFAPTFHVTCLNLLQIFFRRSLNILEIGDFCLLIIPESSMDFKQCGSLKSRQSLDILDQAKRQFVLFNDLFQQLDEEQRNSDPEAPNSWLNDAE